MMQKNGPDADLRPVDQKKPALEKVNQ